MNLLLFLMCVNSPSCNFHNRSLPCWRSHCCCRCPLQGTDYGEMVVAIWYDSSKVIRPRVLGTHHLFTFTIESTRSSILHCGHLQKCRTVMNCTWTCDLWICVITVDHDFTTTRLSLGAQNQNFPPGKAASSQLWQGLVSCQRAALSMVRQHASLSHEHLGLVMDHWFFDAGCWIRRFPAMGVPPNHLFKEDFPL